MNKSSGFKTLAFVLLVLLVTGCSKDKSFSIQDKELVGIWSVEYADKDKTSDSFMSYTLNEDGTCEEEITHQNGGVTFYYQGKWSYVESNDEHVLTINLTVDDKPSQKVYKLTKFSSSKFYAMDDKNVERVFNRLFK